MPDSLHPNARILIVDDEEANVDLLEMLLERAGYRKLFRTTDARQAVPLFEAHHPDLVLLDLLMPHLDGYAVLEQLRRVVPADDYVPVLVLTADITPAAKERALSLGAKDFLTKPFDRLELLLRVKNLLATRLLYVRLQQQYEALQRLYEEAQQTTRVREETHTALSHDLGQPVTVLRVTTQLLRRDAERTGTVDIHKLLAHLETMDATTTRLLGMTSELLDLARLQTGRPLELHRQPTNLVALARGEVTTHQMTTSLHQLTIESCDGDLVGEWDAIRLSRVVSNLLSNAIKYSPEGGLVSVQLCRESGVGREWAVLRVSDEGLGIPAAELPFISQQYYRGSNVTGRTRGTGIGLMGSRHIVEQHGGELTVASAEGIGTTVTVRLPLE